MKKIILLALSTAFMGCNTTSTPASSEMSSVNIKFKAQMNGQDVDCGKTYENIGTTKSKVSLTDFRLYLSNVRLIDDKDKEVKLTLNQDKKWQTGDLALLDFENKTSDCSSGTADINKEIVGKIPKGTYKAIKFNVGVPFDKNHQDPTKAESPLNLTSMFWVWNSGYKFIRLDLKTTGLPQGYFLHLGSTACMSDMSSGMHVKHEVEVDSNATTPPSMCKNPNRPEITLTNFNFEKDNIVLDVDSLLADSNVDTNQDKTPAGCMSGTDDQDCKAVFNNLGLDFETAKSNGQKFFRVNK